MNSEGAAIVSREFVNAIKTYVYNKYGLNTASSKAFFTTRKIYTRFDTKSIINEKLIKDKKLFALRIQNFINTITLNGINNEETYYDIINQWNKDVSSNIIILTNEELNAIRHYITATPEDKLIDSAIATLLILDTPDGDECVIIVLDCLCLKIV